MSPPTCWNTYYQKEITRVGEAVEKKEPLYTVGGNVHWSRHLGNSLNSLQKIKNRTELPYVRPSSLTSGDT